ncbi:hypothetical protein EON76_01920 [bacterium]|nr:MAG: hypothetical protein EON76_01920 [bacterium]
MLDGLRYKIVEMVGDSKGSGYNPGRVRVTEMAIFRRIKHIDDSDADLDEAFAWLVMHEYLKCEDRKRPHTRERIYVFSLKGELEYDEIVESRARRELAAVVA